MVRVMDTQPQEDLHLPLLDDPSLTPSQVPPRRRDRRRRPDRCRHRGLRAGRDAWLDVRPGDPLGPSSAVRFRLPRAPPRALPPVPRPACRWRRAPRRRRPPPPLPGPSRQAGPRTTSRPATRCVATSATWCKALPAVYPEAVVAKLADILGVEDDYPELSMKPAFVQVPNLVLTDALTPLEPDPRWGRQGLQPDDRRDGVADRRADAAGQGRSATTSSGPAPRSASPRATRSARSSRTT